VSTTYIFLLPPYRLSEDQFHLRLLYLPLASTNPHPDTREILDTETTGIPYVPSRGRNSYIKPHHSFIVSLGVLDHLHGGTARLTKEAMKIMKWRILNPREIRLTKMYEKSLRQRLDLLRRRQPLEAEVQKFGCVLHEPITNAL